MSDATAENITGSESAGVVDFGGPSSDLDNWESDAFDGPKGTQETSTDVQEQEDRLPGDETGTEPEQSQDATEHPAENVEEQAPSPEQDGNAGIDPQTAARIADLEAQLAQQAQMNAFWQQHLNELMQRSGQQFGTNPQMQGQNLQQVPPHQQQQPGMFPNQQQSIEPVPNNQLPPGIKSPEEWETTEDQLNYNRFQTQTALQSFQQSVVMPIISRFQKTITDLQEQSIRSMNQDYDTVKKDVVQELFNLAPDGETVLGIKNPALLNYLNAQPNVWQAIYQHGKLRKAPQTIKEGVNKAVASTLQKVAAKPKAPTVPKTSAAPQRQDSFDDISWEDTADRSKVERHLAKSGLLPSRRK